MIINITPVAKPRMTRSDKWKKRPCVLRYRAFCDELRFKYNDNLPDNIVLGFYIPMPQSWSKKKREEMHLKPHKQKPDIDNLIKSVLDALCEDDSYVFGVSARKYWANYGKITISKA